MKTTPSSKPPKQSMVLRATLVVFLILFSSPLVLMPSFVVTKLFPEKKGLESLINDLTHVQDSFLAPFPSLSLEKWLSGVFQEQFNKYFSQNFFTRKLLIKLSNQLYYTFFDKSYMYDQTIIIGKEKWLYELAYIRDYCRLTPFINSAGIDSIAMKMGELQKQLNKRGVSFLVLITPSKASLFPQYIPDIFIDKKITINRDYENLMPILKSSGINFVDGHEITLEQQGKSDIPLFCHGGTHWNYLGAFFTIEKLIEKFSTLKGKSFPQLTYSKVILDRKPTVSDRDLASLLNLLFPPYDFITPHLDITPITSELDFKANIAFVGASFSGVIFDMLCLNGIVNSFDYYFYYRNSLKTFPRNINREASFKVENIDWERDFFTKDVVVLEINEIAFESSYIHDFISDALRHLSAQ